jgi:hypothetical protein
VIARRQDGAPMKKLGIALGLFAYRSLVPAKTRFAIENILCERFNKILSFAVRFLAGNLRGLLPVKCNLLNYRPKI